MLEGVFTCSPTADVRDGPVTPSDTPTPARMISHELQPCSGNLGPASRPHATGEPGLRSGDHRLPPRPVPQKTIIGQGKNDSQ